MLNQPQAGRILQQARFDKDLTLEQLSTDTGVSVTTIVRVEKGEMAYGRTIHSLAKRLQVDPSTLFKSDEPEEASA